MSIFSMSAKKAIKEDCRAAAGIREVNSGVRVEIIDDRELGPRQGHPLLQIMESRRGSKVKVVRVGRVWLENQLFNLAGEL